MEVRFGQRIAVKQAKFILLISLILGFAITATQLYLDLSDQQKQTEEDITQVLTLHVNAANNAIYNLDGLLGLAVTESLIKHPAIVKATLLDDFGDVLAVSVIQNFQPIKHRDIYTLIHIHDKQEVALKSEVNAEQPAKIIINIDQHYLVDQVIERAIRSLIFGVLFTLALSFIFFLLVYQFLSKPIVHIAGWVESLSSDSAVPIPPYRQQDELGNLVDRFRNLWVERDAMTIQLNKTIEDLSRSEYFSRALMDHAGDAMYLCRMDTTIRLLNRQAEKMMGGEAQQFLDRPLSDYSRIYSAKSLQSLFAGVSASNVTEFEDELWTSSIEKAIPLESRGIRVTLENEDYILITSRDITLRRESEKEIHELAYFDPLTKLPNRRLFLDRLTSALHLHESNGLYGAVCYLDLDEFKTVNDSLGHTFGDKMLNIISQRLSHLIPQQGTCARFGGDEFVLLLPELGDTKEHCAEVAAHTVELVLKNLAKPIDIDGQTVYSSGSIGIAEFPSGSISSEQIIQHADTALYRAKAMGRNRYHFYSQDMQNTAKNRLMIEKGLHEAIDNHEFQLWLQPLYDNQNNIISAEGLIRWIHPESGLIPPDEFIYIAEESGQIIEIGNWVIEEATRLLNLWCEQGLPETFKTLAINISPLQFMQVDFVTNLLKRLDEKQVPATMLELEITENMLLNKPDLATQKMQLLKQQGITLAIDDFGTGYSSLKYLQKLPLDILKIDRSFVTDIHVDKEDTAIVEAIIATAEKLDLLTVAEGVEIEQERDVLKALGCNFYQGYLFSRPLPPEDFFTLLTKSSRQTEEL